MTLPYVPMKKSLDFDNPPRKPEKRGPIRVWKDVQPGDIIFSPYFNQDLEVVGVKSNRNWWFLREIEDPKGKALTRANTKLSWFIKRGLVRKGEE